MPRNKTFDLRDRWIACPKCGRHECRERRKECVAPHLAGITFLEIRCLSCGHQERRREVSPS